MNLHPLVSVQARQTVKQTFSVSTVQKKTAKHEDEGEPARHCHVPIAIAHYWDKETQLGSARPLTVKQLKSILSEVYSGAEQMLHQPGMTATNEVWHKHLRHTDKHVLVTSTTSQSQVESWYTLIA